MDSENNSIVLFHVDEVGMVTRGWAYDSRQTGPARVTLWIDGRDCGEFDADEFRPDLQKLGYRGGLCGFRFYVPQVFADGEEHDLMLTLGAERRPMLPSVIRVRLDAGEVAGSVEGSLDAIDDRFYVTGWVSDGEGDDVEICDGERVLARGPAGVVRPDLLLAEKHGRGFRIHLDPACIERPVTRLVARCGGQLLSGVLVIEAEKRATLFAEPTHDGRLRVTLAGWSVDEAELEVLVDGAVHSHVVVRADVSGAAGADVARLDNYWEAPPELLDSRRHVVQVRGAGALAALATDPVFVRWPEYRINIDQVDERSLSGWALRLGEPRSLRLEVRITGLETTEVRANLSRVDVAHALELPNDLVGFHVAVGSCLEGRRIEIVDADAGHTLATIGVADPAAALVAMSRDAFAAEASGDPAPRQLIAAARAAFPVEPMVAVDYLPDASAGTAAAGVDVIIPVYSGAAETVECIESVLANSNRTRSRLILVNDRSPDPRITEYLRRIADRNPGNVVLIERQRNGGFSEAVNIGMTVAGRSDVVLLNADTVVNGDWLDRLVAVAATDPTIGTVTPFSNNGEVCSLPYLCKSLAVEERSQLESLDRHAAAGAAGPVDLPVAVGYCMYIRRACIDELGMFDAKTWGRGYGEEVDFCLKASARGWRHVLATDVFVIHRGGVSFGDEKLVRIQESSKKIAERYPFYDRLIQAFLRKDPPAKTRRRVNLAVLGERLPAPRILHVTHSFGGGTERYVRDLSRMYARAGHVNAVISFTAEGRGALKIDTARAGMPALFLPVHEERYDVDEADALIAELDALGFDRIHLHAPFGIPERVMAWIAATSELDVTIHDYAWICPRVTLRDRAGRPCDADGGVCAQCIDPEESHPGLHSVVQRTGSDIARYRAYFGAVLAKARRVFVGGQDVVQRMRAAGIDARFRVVAHPHLAESTSGYRPRGVAIHGSGPYRVALIGGISEIKGYSRLIECAREALRQKLPLEFIVVGETEDNAALAPFANVKVLGRYAEDQLHALLDSRMPDVALFLNQVPETFSYTLSAAFERGLWPVVTDIGVPAERVRATGFGDVFATDISTEALLAFLQDVARQRRLSPLPPPAFERPATLGEYRGE